jgi:aminoglycoside phosphotransferase
MGVTRVMELPRSLRRRGASETSSMAALLAREAARIAWFAARAPERARLLKARPRRWECMIA